MLFLYVVQRPAERSDRAALWFHRKKDVARGWMR